MNSSKSSEFSPLENLLQQKKVLQQEKDCINEAKEQLKLRERECLDDVIAKFNDLIVRLEKKKKEIETSIQEQYRKTFAEFVILDYQLQQKINEIDQLKFFQMMTPTVSALPKIDFKITVNYSQLIAEIDRLHVLQQEITADGNRPALVHWIEVQPITTSSHQVHTGSDIRKRVYSTDSTSLSPPCKQIKVESDSIASTSLLSSSSSSSFTLNGEVKGGQTSSNSRSTTTSASSDVFSETISKQSTNVRSVVNCTLCRKPRCIYGKRSLTRDEMIQLDEWKLSCDYVCGVVTLPRSSALFNLLTLEPEVTCDKDVSYHYFSSSHKFPEVCYKCGAHSSKLITYNDEELQQYAAFHRICVECNDDGQKPRRRKKCQKTVNDP